MYKTTPNFLVKNLGFELLPVYKMTSILVEGAPHGWLKVRDSITTDPQYEELAWRMVLSFEYVVTMAKFTVFVLCNSRCF